MSLLELQLTTNCLWSLIKKKSLKKWKFYKVVIQKQSKSLSKLIKKRGKNAKKIY